MPANFQLLKRVSGHTVPVPAWDKYPQRANGLYTVESVYAFLQDCFHITQATVGIYVKAAEKYYRVHLVEIDGVKVACWTVSQTEHLLYTLDRDGHVPMPRYMA